MKKTQATKLDLRGIGWFSALAFGIAWLFQVTRLGEFLGGRLVHPPKTPPPVLYR